MTFLRRHILILCCFQCFTLHNFFFIFSLTSHPSWCCPLLYVHCPRPVPPYFPCPYPPHPSNFSSSSLTPHPLPTLQEEESPDSGELRRAESSPTPLKRDRSFSEHDLALLRGEMLPSLSESAQLGRVVRLRGERPRSRTLTGSKPPLNYRGQYLNVDRLSLVIVLQFVNGHFSI